MDTDHGLYSLIADITNWATFKIGRVNDHLLVSGVILFAGIESVDLASTAKLEACCLHGQWFHELITQHLLLERVIVYCLGCAVIERDSSKFDIVAECAVRLDVLQAVLLGSATVKGDYAALGFVLIIEISQIVAHWHGYAPLWVDDDQ